MAQAPAQTYDQFGLPIGIGQTRPQTYDQFGLPVGSCEIPTAEDVKLAQLIAEMAADPNHGAIKIVVTPAQMAAVFEHETLTNDEPRMTTRLFGAVRMLGSFVEGGAAVALAAAPEPTLVTKAASIGVAMYAADQFTTAAGEMWTGRYKGSLMSQGVAAGAKALGATDTTAETIGMASEMIVPVGAAAYLGAIRLAAVKAGRFSLALHEGPSPPGGHTIARHVGKDRQFLESRLLKAVRVFEQNSNIKVPKSFSTFFSMEEAEKFISQALRAKRAEIEAWAKTAPAGKTQPFIVDFGNEVVGWGLLARGWTNDVPIIYRTFTKLRIVMKKETYNGMLYFILTCYPVL